MLLSLPWDAMEAILLYLRPQDIANCAHVSRSMRDVVYSEHLWQARLESVSRHLGPATDLCRWRV